MEKDEQKALSLYQQAAAKGSAAAEYNLGVSYLNGSLGLKKDKAEALKYFERSSAKGHKDAAAQVAKMKSWWFW